eukprot:98523_1
MGDHGDHFGTESEFSDESYGLSDGNMSDFNPWTGKTLDGKKPHKKHGNLDESAGSSSSSDSSLESLVPIEEEEAIDTNDEFSSDDDRSPLTRKDFGVRATSLQHLPMSPKAVSPCKVCGDKKAKAIRFQCTGCPREKGDKCKPSYCVTKAKVCFTVYHQNPARYTKEDLKHHKKKGHGKKKKTKKKRGAKKRVMSKKKTEKVTPKKRQA